MKFLLSMILSILLIMNVVNSLINGECTDWEECVNTQKSAKEIRCSGARSCEYAHSLTAQTFVECVGSRSCRDTMNGLEAVKNNGKVLCSGYDSCSDVSSIKSRFVQCYGEQSCLQSVPSSHITISTDRALCFGRASCFHANIDSGATVQCNGEASCNSTTIDSELKVSCWGNRACAYSEITSLEHVECYGYRSCYGTVITQASEVKIHGVAAGDFMHIVNVPIVEAYSGFTLSQAIIDSGSSPEMSVELFGVSLDEHFDTTLVICRSGAICTLVCKDNGCHLLEYRCETGAICKLRPTLCLQNPSGGIINGRDCPQMTNVPPSTIYVHEQKEIIRRDIISGINTDSDKAEYTECNVRNECAGERIEDRNDGIMCRGKTSCELAILFADNREKIVGCSGALSCHQSKIESSNVLYCYGQESCKEALILSAGDIQCLGVGACYEMTLSITKSVNSPFLECGSYQSCYGMTMKGNSKDITNIECNGYESCRLAQFEVKNNVLCEGSNSCQGSTLTSGSKVECIGYESCSKSTLIIEDEIQLKGSFAALDANIKYANLRSGDHTDSPIKAEGFRSLTGAVIDSALSTSIVVQLLGHLAGYGGTVICRRNSECTVVCHTTGCKELDFVCEYNAICNVRPAGCDGSVPNFEGVGCPNIITDATPSDIEELLERKKMDRDLLEDLLDEYQYEELKKNQQLNVLFGVESLTNSQSLLVGIVAVLCVFSLVYLWYKLKYIEYNQLK